MYIYRDRFLTIWTLHILLKICYPYDTFVCNHVIYVNNTVFIESMVWIYCLMKASFGQISLDFRHSDPERLIPRFKHNDSTINIWSVQYLAGHHSDNAYIWDTPHCQSSRKDNSLAWRRWVGWTLCFVDSISSLLRVGFSEYYMFWKEHEFYLKTLDIRLRSKP